MSDSAALPLLTRFGELLHPSNPVVFLEIATEVAHGKAKPAPNEKGRIFIELFAHWCPLMADNFKQLCTGEARRRNNPAGGPIGYRGSFLYSAVPGREVVGGDVVRGDGSGAPFSVHDTANGPYLCDSLVPNGFKRERLSGHPGLVRMIPSPIPASATDHATNSGVPHVSVGSSFSITCVPPIELPQTWLDAHWTTVVGRVVGLQLETSASSNATDGGHNRGVAEALALLDKCGRDIYTARRTVGERASSTSGLPIVSQCGEM